MQNISQLPWTSRAGLQSSVLRSWPVSASSCRRGHPDDGAPGTDAPVGRSGPVGRKRAPYRYEPGRLVSFRRRLTVKTCAPTVRLVCFKSFKSLTCLGRNLCERMLNENTNWEQCLREFVSCACFGLGFSSFEICSTRVVLV